jgi:hypothetical protein
MMQAEIVPRDHAHALARFSVERFKRHGKGIQARPIIMPA